MAKNDIVGKIIVKVHLVNGEQLIHEYDSPSSDKEVRELARKLVFRTAALTKGELKVGGSKILHFENPHIIYNPDNVAGIDISAIGVEELKKALEIAQRKAGFR